MAKRTKHDQTCHNSAVRRSAGMLKANGWSIKADISGYKQPNSICIDDVCKRPDIVAKKRWSYENY